MVFTVVNKGKRVHDFTVFGKKTRKIKPAQSARLLGFAVVRGRFIHGSTLDKGRAFRGSFVIR
jgi:hypothetical protein